MEHQSSSSIDSDQDFQDCFESEYDMHNIQNQKIQQKEQTVNQQNNEDNLQETDKEDEFEDNQENEIQVLEENEEQDQEEQQANQKNMQEKPLCQQMKRIEINKKDKDVYEFQNLHFVQELYAQDSECPQTSVISCLQFSPDGKMLAAAGEDGILRIWDVIVLDIRTLCTSQCTKVLRQHEKSIVDMS